MPPRVDSSTGQSALRDEMMQLNQRIKTRLRRITELDQAVNIAGVQPTAPNSTPSSNNEAAELNRQILIRQTRIAEINKQLSKAPKR